MKRVRRPAVQSVYLSLRTVPAPFERGAVAANGWGDRERCETLLAGSRCCSLEERAGGEGSVGLVPAGHGVEGDGRAGCDC